jgi:transcriptional regulator with XRE-family HTH domain
MAALSVIPQLAERLRVARVQAGVSKEFAAVTIGRSWSSISGYERGHTVPPLEVIEALAGLYGVRVPDLLDDQRIDQWCQDHLATAPPMRDEVVRATAAHLGGADPRG